MERTHKSAYMRCEKKIVNNLWEGNFTPTFYVNNPEEVQSPIMNELPVPFEYDARVGVGKKKKTIKDEAMVQYSVLMQGIDNCEKLSIFDRQVHDIICNLYDEGYRLMSLTDIYNYLYPVSNKSKRERKNIGKSIMRLNGTVIDCDFSEEAKAFGYDRYFKNLRIKGRLINYNVIRWDDLSEEFKKDFPNYKNPPKGVLEILGEPLLLRLAKANKSQVQYVPRSLTLDRDYKEIPRSKWNEILFDKLISLIPIVRRKGKAEFIYSHLAEKIGMTDKHRKAELPDRFIKIVKWFVENKCFGGYQEFDFNNKAIDREKDKQKPRKIVIYPVKKVQEIEADTKEVDKNKSYSR